MVNHFASSNFSAVGASTISDVGRILDEHFVDLLVSNISISGHSVVDFIERRQRRGSHVPVVFMADTYSQIDRVRALEVGDDIVQKPVAIKELIARARAVLRRFATAKCWSIAKNIKLANEPFQFCGATVSPKDSTVAFPNGNVIEVGRKEIGLMAMFAAADGAVVSRKDIIVNVWGLHADIQSRSLDQYIVRIRRLFHKNGCFAIDLLRTIHGVGYLFALRDLEKGSPKSPAPRQTLD
jgi:two-component system alkaline phosphatase synthesis response regulator PhoP